MKPEQPNHYTDEQLEHLRTRAFSDADLVRARVLRADGPGAKHKTGESTIINSNYEAAELYGKS